MQGIYRTITVGGLANTLGNERTPGAGSKCFGSDLGPTAAIELVGEKENKGGAIYRKKQEKLELQDHIGDWAGGGGGGAGGTCTTAVAAQGETKESAAPVQKQKL